MCYSKEVSLLAGTAISAFSAYGWMKYHVQKTKLLVEKKIKANSDRLIGFGTNLILGYLCIAGHQLFEFLAIWLNNEIIYKTGLLVSISATYFFVKAFEKLSKLDFYSKLIPVIIAVLGFYQFFFAEFRFENYKFWVRGLDHWIWGTTWASFFVYNNVIAGYLALKSKSKVNRMLLLVGSYGLLNLSYYVSVGYAVIATLGQSWFGGLCYVPSVMDGFKILNDFASLWCTFAVIQGPFLLGVIAWFWKKYDVEAGFNVKKITWKHFLMFVAITAGLMIFTKVASPLIYGVSWKMVSK